MAKKAKKKPTGPPKKITPAPSPVKDPGSPMTGTTGTATTTTPSATGPAGSTSNSGTAGSADLTSATTTATLPTDVAADQSDQDLQAFFSSGVGSAMHYDMAAQQHEQNATASPTAPAQTG